MSPAPDSRNVVCVYRRSLPVLHVTARARRYSWYVDSAPLVVRVMLVRVSLVMMEDGGRRGGAMLNKGVVSGRVTPPIRMTPCTDANWCDTRCQFNYFETILHHFERVSILYTHL